ncbi:hypothetical protein N7468_001939 [Penicillium chermesinum]|uniref:Thioredoxin-like fold domain-containing protein n=1 Tax=Penicillium chermesinum TaxID=63820 RepID=A0A9W9PJ94_9EURO|nr:uncharacterized protein N7468_001939 [Penicillium chermesinum]KAJ5246956.1 hypothetical protein N7468_001939 [Penicillium chermesinum]KAJ6145208.1 hypothetical protein N7470_009103 [Penicillium chermesinum]
MSAPPKFAGLKLSTQPPQGSQHTLELYLDYVCPFSAKLFNTFYTLDTLLAEYGPKLQVIFRPHIQPWHPSSTLTHEAALAVLRLAPEKFWEFSSALFKHQTEYFDVSVVNETRNKTYERLARLARSVGVDEQKTLALLKIPESSEKDNLNSGNQVTDDLKWVIKTDRVIGVHASPTVFFNGVEERSISSSFTVEQWKEWLAHNVT